MISPKENHGVDTGKWENGCWVDENDTCPLETWDPHGIVEEIEHKRG